MALRGADPLPPALAAQPRVARASGEDRPGNTHRHSARRTILLPSEKLLRRAGSAAVLPLRRDPTPELQPRAHPRHPLADTRAIAAGTNRVPALRRGF